MGILSAVGLLALVAGLLRGKRLAWYLAMAIYGVSLLGDLLVVWEPSGAILSCLALCALVVGRRRFDVETGPAWRRRVLALVVGGLGLMLAGGLVRAGSAGLPAGPLLRSTVAGLAAATGAGNDTALLRGSANAFFAQMIVFSHGLFVLASLAVLAAVPEPATDDQTRRRARAMK